MNKRDSRQIVVGVDAWKKGWVAVVVRGGAVEAVRTFSAFAELAAELGDAAVIGVDMPIGLPKAGRRRADVEARHLLEKRRSSLFLLPPRPVLAEPTYARARQRAEELGSQGVSAQAYALRGKIFEVEEVALRDRRVIEVHPEMSFAAMAEAPLEHGKKTWNGQMARRRLLEQKGLVLPGDLGAAGEVPTDDVLDAAAAAWTAMRYAQGEAKSLPAEPEVDGLGLKMAIWR
jgi:predicted RNase H-like nuclease